MRIGHCVLLAWVGLSLWQLVFVIQYSRDYPVCEEWLDVPAILGDGPRWSWIFERLQEHRYIFGRLVYLAVFEAAGQDYRAGMFANCTILSLAALLIIRLAARLRGQSHAIDLTIPFLMLGPNHHENLLLGFQVYFTLNILLAAGWLWLIVAASERWQGLAASGLLLLFALGGGVGLAFVPVCGLWIGYYAVQSVRKGRYSSAVVMLVAVAITYGYMMWATLDVIRVPVSGRVASDHETLIRVALEFLGTGFGLPAVMKGSAAGFIVLFLAAATSAGLIIVAIRHSEQRSVALGILVIVLAIGIMAIGVGQYRTSAFASRYTSLAALVPVTAILTGAVYAPCFGRVGTVLGWMAAISAGAMCWQGRPMAEYMGRFFRTGFERMTADSRNGIPVEFLASRTQMFPNTAFSEAVRGLRGRGRGPVGFAPDAPALHAISVGIHPAMTPWPTGPEDAIAVGQPPVWQIELDEPRPVIGVRVRFQFSQADYQVPLQLAWTEGAAFHHATSFLWLGEGTWEALFWVNGPVSRIWFRPAKEPHRIDMLGAELLLATDTMTGTPPLSR